jgi:hypothetical protein
MAPSMLCHDHAIPSISSYSAKPLRQSFTNTPFFFHSRKYLCTELALPYSCFGNAFHWHPVRKTKTMAASTFRGSMAFRPAPARRKYFRLLSRLGFGISGSARSQNSSDIVHDLKAFMAYNVVQTAAESNNLFTDNHLGPFSSKPLVNSAGKFLDPTVAPFSCIGSKSLQKLTRFEPCLGYS